MPRRRSFSNNTGFKDCHDKDIHGGMAVDVFDDEGYCEPGIVTRFKGEWVVVNPWRERRLGFRTITEVKHFSPKNIEILMSRSVNKYILSKEQKV